MDADLVLFECTEFTRSKRFIRFRGALWLLASCIRLADLKQSMSTGRIPEHTNNAMLSVIAGINLKRNALFWRIKIFSRFDFEVWPHTERP